MPEKSISRYPPHRKPCYDSAANLTSNNAFDFETNEMKTNARARARYAQLISMITTACSDGRLHRVAGVGRLAPINTFRTVGLLCVGASVDVGLGYLHCWSVMVWMVN